jgi:galactokinase
LIELFVPGRLCLFGEHSDWAGGYRRRHPSLAEGLCLVAGTEQGLRGRAEPLADTIELSSRLPDGRREGPLRVPARVEACRELAAAGGFFAYAAGVAAECLERCGGGGLRLEIEADLPPARGLSSSAALCVLVARAFSRVHGLGLAAREEMELAYAGERRAGSACGRMDQVCALGRGPFLLRFDADEIGIEPAPSAGRFHLLLVDLRRGKDTRRILADLNACFPDVPGPLAAGVREALGPLNRAIVERARGALASGDAAALGRLMDEAQELFFRQVAPACPELEAPALRRALAHPAVRELAWGGKGVGSQGDGCAQLVARGPQARAELAARLERELAVACLPLTLEPPPTAAHSATSPER